MVPSLCRQPSQCHSSIFVSKGHTAKSRDLNSVCFRGQAVSHRPRETPHAFISCCSQHVICDQKLRHSTGNMRTTGHWWILVMTSAGTVWPRLPPVLAKNKLYGWENEGTRGHLNEVSHDWEGAEPGLTMESAFSVTIFCSHPRVCEVHFVNREYNICEYV